MLSGLQATIAIDVLLKISVKLSIDLNVCVLYSMPLELSTYSISLLRHYQEIKIPYL